MAPSNKPFGAVSAKTYTGAQGIKQFFAGIQPKNLGGRPPKKRKKNVLIDANTSSAMTTAPDSPPDSPLIVDVLVTEAIAVVVAQSWLGVDCPLTTLESWLRAQAGAAGFVQQHGEAARAAGASPFQIVTRAILPQALRRFHHRPRSSAMCRRSPCSSQQHPVRRERRGRRQEKRRMRRHWAYRTG